MTEQLTDEQRKEIEKFVNEVEPTKFNVLWITKDCLDAVSEAKVHDWLRQLLDENQALKESNGWDEEHEYALNQEVYRLMNENQAQAKEIDRYREMIEKIQTTACMNRYNAIESIIELTGQALGGNS